MKELIITLATGMFLLFVISVQAEVTRPEKIAVSNTEIVESAAVTVLIDRVNEINAMDKSSLNATEKKALRKELRSIKKEVNATSNGGVIYVSGGLILLIILPIILL